MPKFADLELRHKHLHPPPLSLSFFLEWEFLSNSCFIIYPPGIRLTVAVGPSAPPGPVSTPAAVISAVPTATAALALARSTPHPSTDAPYLKSPDPLLQRSNIHPYLHELPDTMNDIHT